MKRFIYPLLLALLCLAGAKSMPVRVDAVLGVTMKVADMNRSVDFYTHVLPFRLVSDSEAAGEDLDRLEGLSGTRIRAVRLRLGEEEIELEQFIQPSGAMIPADSRSNDLWFQHIAIVVRDMERAYAQLEKNGVPHISVYPQTLPEWNKAAGGIQAYYFRDPDGHNLELISFPKGKGDPKWQERRDDIFLGIDHTAIAVKNTQQSLRFYQTYLGFHVAGISENYGPEQEALNAVPGAHLRITGLRSPHGPGIEFLEYLAPEGGREKSKTAQPNDLEDTETRLTVSNISGLILELQKHGVSILAEEPSSVPEIGVKKGYILRDPDGHALRIDS